MATELTDTKRQEQANELAAIPKTAKTDPKAAIEALKSATDFRVRLSDAISLKDHPDVFKAAAEIGNPEFFSALIEKCAEQQKPKTHSQGIADAASVLNGDQKIGSQCLELLFERIKTREAAIKNPKEQQTDPQLTADLTMVTILIKAGADASNVLPLATPRTLQHITGTAMNGVKIDTKVTGRAEENLKKPGVMAKVIAKLPTEALIDGTGKRTRLGDTLAGIATNMLNLDNKALGAGDLLDTAIKNADDRRLQYLTSLGNPSHKIPLTTDTLDLADKAQTNQANIQALLSKTYGKQYDAHKKAKEGKTEQQPEPTGALTPGATPVASIPASGRAFS